MSNHEPEKSRPPRDDARLDLTKSSGLLGARETHEPSHADLISEAADRAIVAFEMLPLLANFFGSTGERSSSGMPHGMSAEDLLSPEALSSRNESSATRGSAIFSSQSSVRMFLHDQAALIERADPESRRALFRTVKRTVLEALDEVRFNLAYTQAFEIRYTLRPEKEPASELRAYIPKARELEQLLADGKPRPHLDYAEAILQEGQERLGTRLSMERTQHRKALDRTSLEHMPKSLRYSVQRLIYCAGRFLSFPVVGEFHFLAGVGPAGQFFSDRTGVVNTTATGSKYPEAADQESELEKHPSGQSRSSWSRKQSDEPGPHYREHAICPASALASLLKCLMKNAPLNLGKSEPLLPYEAIQIVQPVRELCVNINEVVRTAATTQFRADAEEVLAILYGALRHIERGCDRAEIGRLSDGIHGWIREGQWYRELLSMLESAFGNTLLEGYSHSRSAIPEVARQSTALVSESRAIAEWFLKISPPLQAHESAFLSNIIGVPDLDLQAAHKSWRFLRSPRIDPPNISLGAMFDPIPGPPIYRPMVITDMNFLATLANLKIEIGERILPQIARMTAKERQSVKGRLEHLIREVGIGRYQISSILSDPKGWQVALAALEASIEYKGQGLERLPATGSLPRVQAAARHWVVSESSRKIRWHPLVPKLREVLTKPSDFTPREFVHAALLLVLAGSHTSPRFEASFAEWRGQLPLDALVELLTHTNPLLQESAFDLFKSGQIEPLMNWLRVAPANTLSGLLVGGVRFAQEGAEFGPSRRVDPQAFMVMFVGHLLSRFKQFPHSLTREQYEGEVRECMREAKDRTQELKDSQNSERALDKLAALGLDSAQADAYNRGFDIITSAQTSSELSARERFQLSRLLGQLPEHFAAPSLAILRGCKIRPETLAQSGVLQALTATQLLLTTNDLKIALDILERIAAKGSPVATLACASELLRVAVRSDRRGYEEIADREYSLADPQARKSAFDAFFSGSMDVLSSVYFAVHRSRSSGIAAGQNPAGDRGAPKSTSVTPSKGEMEKSISASFKAYLLKSPFAMASLKRALAENPGLKWLKHDVGPLTPEEVASLYSGMKPGAGITKELEVISSFIDDFRPIRAQYLFAFYRALKMQHEYCPSELIITNSNAWREWPDYLFPRDLKPGSRLFADEQALMDYAWKTTESFIHNPEKFTPKLIVDFELVALACRIYRTGELDSTQVLKQVTKMLGYGRKFSRWDGDREVIEPRRNSVFDALPSMPEREAQVPRARINTRDLKLADCPGPFQSSALDQFEADAAVLGSVIERGVPEVLREVCGRLGLSLSNESLSDEESEALNRDRFHQECLSLVTQLATQPADTASYDDLRNIFLAHASRDRRLLGSALRMNTYCDLVERVTSFVEFVGAGAKDPDWLELLGRSSPDLRARFEKVSDIDYLLSPLSQLIKSGTSSTTTSSEEQRAASGATPTKSKGVAGQHVGIRMRLHRHAPIFAVGPICDSCITEPLHKHPSKALITFGEQGRANRPVGATFSGGFILIHTTTPDGQGTLIIRGYNPAFTLLNKVSIDRLFDEAVRFIAEEIAPKLGVTQILAPLDTIPGMAFSNRALAHLSFKMRYRDAPHVPVTDEAVIFNRYDIRDRCVRIWAK